MALDAHTGGAKARQPGCMGKDGIGAPARIEAVKREPGIAGPTDVQTPAGVNGAPPVRRIVRRECSEERIEQVAGFVGLGARSMVFLQSPM